MRMERAAAVRMSSRFEHRLSALLGDGDASGRRKPRLQIESERLVLGIVEHGGLGILVDQGRPQAVHVLYSLWPGCCLRGGVMDEDLGIERFRLLGFCLK